MIKKMIAWAVAAMVCTSCTAKQNTTETMSETKSTESRDALVDIKTTEGDIQVRLFGDTPAHRDNFLKLAREGYYDGVLFHRVINDFMIQTGDPDSKTARPGQQLGSGGPDYTLVAEIVYPKHFHHRGALAAARQGDQVNPERRSSGSQFYIVTGRAYNDSTLQQMERQMEMGQMQQIFNKKAAAHRDEIMAMRRNGDQAGLQALQERLISETEAEAKANPARLTAEQRQAYTTVGGAPHLDGQYTVFGEVTKGMDVVERIEKVETDRSDRPKQDVKIISMKVVEE